MGIASLLVAVRQSLVYPITSGFIFGTLIGPSVSSVFLAGLVAAISVGLIVWTIVTRVVHTDNDSHHFSTIFVLAVMMLATVGGVVAFWIAVTKHGDPTLEHYVGHYVLYTGVVTDDPIDTDTTTKVVVTVQTLFNQTLTNPTKITFSLPLYTEIAYGDEIGGGGILEKPNTFQTDTGGTFSYDTYLAARHIFYTLTNPHITIRAHKKGGAIKTFLFNLKKMYLQRLDVVIPFPESRLAAALTIAGKEALPTNIRDDFLRAGIIPIVVLSGFHVTIVAEMIGWLVVIFSSYILERFIPSFVARIFSYATIIIGIMFFCVMAGGAAAIVRGGIMAGAVVTAKLFQRRYSVYRALWISAFLMLLVNPLLTVYDVSFQFSFVAVAGLVYGGPIFSQAFWFLPERWGIRSVVTSTMAAQFCVAPLALYVMGQCSVIVVITNLLVFFFIPPTMFLSFMTALTAFFSPIISLPFAAIAWMLLAYEITVVHILASLPFAFWQFPSIPNWTLGVAYGAIILFIVRWFGWNTTSSLPSKDFVRR